MSSSSTPHQEEEHSPHNMPSSLWHRCYNATIPRLLLLFSWSGEDWSLVLVAITHTYLLFHCAPYIGYMTVQLLLFRNNNNTPTTTTVDSVGVYVGLLGTAFTGGRCVSFVPWKNLRRKWGSTKQVLILSLFFSAVTSLWFGLSKSYAGALLARFVLGCSNTLSGCIKRIVMDRVSSSANDSSATHVQNDNEEEEDCSRNNNGEINNNDKEQKEEMAPSLVLSIMMWGSALGPCMGGMLSNPGAYSKDTILPDLIDDEYPFFLPNLVAFILCVVSMIAVAVFVVEKKNENSSIGTTTSRTITATTVSSTPEERRPILPSSTTKQQLNKDDEQQQRSFHHAQIWKSKNAQLHFLAYWTFSFVVVCIDEALPLFLIARWSGPGLSPRQIGWILSVGGFLTICLDTTTSSSASHFDLTSRMYRTLSISAVMANLPAVLVPLILVFNGGTYYQVTTTTATEQQESPTTSTTFDAQPGFLSWQSFLFVAILMGLLRLFSSQYFSLIGIATSRIVPPTHRDEVARIMTRGALVARAVSPVVAGWIVSLFMTTTTTTTTSGGSNNKLDPFGLWIVLGLVLGLGAAIVTMWLEDTTPMAGTATTAAKMLERSEKRKRYYLDQRQRARVHVRLWEVHYDRDGGSQPTTVASQWRRLTRKVIAINRIATAGYQHHHHDDNDTKPEETQQRRRRTSWVDHILRPGLDLERASFLILGTTPNDPACSPHTLTPPVMEELLQHVPLACRHQNIWLRYSLLRDGDSIPALEQKIGMSKNTIFAIETLQGDVFGCFMTYKWQKSNRYELCGESFLWRQRRKDNKSNDDDTNEDTSSLLQPLLDIFPWTGANEDCQFFSNERIGVGGGGGDGFGFIIEDGLWRGSSSPCATYNNPCLVTTTSDHDGMFEVANLEVWCLTPHMFVEEAIQSEASRRFLMENVSSNSVTSSWTKYL